MYAGSLSDCSRGSRLSDVRIKCESIRGISDKIVQKRKEKNTQFQRSQLE
jgi:hypothetical protein